MTDIFEREKKKEEPVKTQKGDNEATRTVLK